LFDSSISLITTRHDSDKTTMIVTRQPQNIQPEAFTRTTRHDQLTTPLITQLNNNLVVMGGPPTRRLCYLQEVIYVRPWHQQQ